MTVAAAAAKAGPYTGNDSASAFAFAFKIFADTDIRVVATVIATGVESDLVLNTNYTVTRNVDQDNDPGGTVTYKVGGVTTAYPSTHKLTIVGDFTYEQPTDIPNGGAFFANIIENALDRLTMLIKQAQEKLDRAVTVGVSDTTDPAALIDGLTADAATATAAAAAAQAAQALAEAAAGNLPNAVTAGANRFLKTNPAGTEWSYSLLHLPNAGADIASAATIDLTAATGNSPRITGTTPTSAVTMNTGQSMLVVADGSWPLTYHATTNKLNTGGASYTCAAGDLVLYHKDLSGVVHGTILSVSGIGLDTQTQRFAAFLTGGTSSAFTLTPTPAISALQANMRFTVSFHASPVEGATLSVSGTTAKLLKIYDGFGGKTSVLPEDIMSVSTNTISDVVYDGTDFVVLNVPTRSRKIVYNGESSTHRRAEISKAFTMTASSTIDVATCMLFDNYGCAYCEVIAAGVGTTGTEHLVRAARFVKMTGDSPVFTTIGTDNLVNCTIAFSYVANHGFKATITNSIAVNVYGGMSMTVVGGGSDGADSGIVSIA